VIGKLLILFVSVGLIWVICGGRGSFSEELLPAQPLLLEVHKEFILQDHCVVHVAIVVEIEIVIENLLDLIGQ
jgi:hypothetical protein